MTRRACLVSVVLVLLLAGCGGGPYKLAPVSGTVTLDGKALPNAIVTFVPAGGAAGDKDPLPSSVGTTDENGHYSLVLTRDINSKGAVVAKHKVIIVLGAGDVSNETKPTFHKHLPVQYNRNTKLECDVPAGGKDDADFPLKSR
jgi:hypothetical protein